MLGGAARAVTYRLRVLILQVGHEVGLTLIALVAAADTDACSLFAAAALMQYSRMRCRQSGHV